MILRGRPYEVLVLVSAGKTNREIARDLGIRVNTVKSYLKRAAEMLDIPNKRSLLVATGYRRAILPLAPARPDARLTEVQLETLELMAEGLSYEEIGAKLYLALDTVKSRQRRLAAALDLPNVRTLLVAEGFRCGFLEV